MKKNIFLILLLISSNFILGQDFQELKLTIHGVESVQLDFNNLTTNQIYERSLMWVEETFVNAKDVLNENSKLNFYKFIEINKNKIILFKKN